MGEQYTKLANNTCTSVPDLGKGAKWANALGPTFLGAHTFDKNNNVIDNFINFF